MKKLAVVVAGVLVALALSAPAQAETVSQSDPRDSSLPASGDIRRVTVNNGDSTFRTTIKLRKAVADRTSAFAILENQKTGARFSVGTESTGRGHHRIFVKFDKNDNATKVGCKRLRVVIDESREQVRISFPQACLGRHAGRLSVGALTEGTNRGGDLDLVDPTPVARG